eukprot:jgi/Mesen1/3925/ME000209S02930
MANARKFIVAVDATEASAYAFTWAITNLVKENDHVLILNSAAYATSDVLPTVDLAAGGEYAVPAVMPVEPEEEEKIVDLSKGLVDKYMRQCAQAKIHCEGEITKGDPGAHIVEEAEKQNVDAVVIGCHDVGALQRAFLGSISDHVLHNCPVPVVIVRSPKDSTEHEPLTNTGLCRTIVIPVDESNESVYAFRWALQHVCTGADKVVILHVEYPALASPTTTGIDGFGIEEVYVPADGSSQEDVRLRDTSEKLVERFMKYAASETKVHCEGKVVSGPTDEKVLEEVRSLQADAVVVGSHEKSFMNSPCPVIVAKMPKIAREALADSNAGRKPHEG